MLKQPILLVLVLVCLLLPYTPSIKADPEICHNCDPRVEGDVIHRNGNITSLYSGHAGHYIGSNMVGDVIVIRHILTAFHTFLIWVRHLGHHKTIQHHSVQSGKFALKCWNKKSNPYPIVAIENKTPSPQAVFISVWSKN